MVFFLLNQSYDIIICVYSFELFSQVSDVTLGPLVLHLVSLAITSLSNLLMIMASWLLSFHL